MQGIVSIGSRPAALRITPPMDPLTALAVRHGSDKAAHGFCAFYHRLLEARREHVERALEIGVLTGASLRMWRDYLPHATIHGFDLPGNSVADEDRLRVHSGDQSSRRSLNQLLQRTGSPFDLIVDDGGHTMEQQQVSLGFLFAHLRPGGLYVIEDLHTSFAREIVWQRDGKVVSTYATGADDGSPTTYALVAALAAGGAAAASQHLSAPELAFLRSEVRGIEVFDRDGDRAHLTCALWRRAA
jgi:hypothetical protein